MRHILLNVIVFASMGISCADSQNKSVLNNSDNPLKIYLSKSENNIRIFAASSPTPVESASICQLDNGQCIPNTIINLVNADPDSGQKTMYATSELSGSLKGKYLLSMGSNSRQIFFGEENENRPSSWKSVFLSGDYVDEGRAVVAWDNARKDLGKLLLDRGFSKSNTIQLSRDPQQVQSAGADGDASLSGLSNAFDKLRVGDNDACFLYMTSHGTEQGFYIEGGGVITPSQFANLLDQKCGNRPTVAIISACYAGIMINNATKRDNRIIFTAASATRTSNGCQAGIRYTWFDECLISSMQDKNIITWRDLGTKTKACINAKENVSNASDPQFFYGNSVQNLNISG